MNGIRLYCPTTKAWVESRSGSWGQWSAAKVHFLLLSIVTRFGKISPIWQYSASLWAISKSLANFIPYIVNFYAFGRIFIGINGPILKNNLAIWSHWPQMIMIWEWGCQLFYCLLTNSIIRSLENPLASAAAMRRSLNASVIAGTMRPVSVTYSHDGDVSPVLICDQYS